MNDPKELKVIQTKHGLILMFGHHFQHKEASRMVPDKPIRAGFCRANLIGDHEIVCYGTSSSTNLEFKNYIQVIPSEYKFYKLKEYGENSGIVMVPRDLSHEEFKWQHYEWEEFEPQVVLDYYDEEEYDFLQFCNRLR